jgi:hypothetical protein
MRQAKKTAALSFSIGIFMRLAAIDFVLAFPLVPLSEQNPFSA